MKTRVALASLCLLLALPSTSEAGTLTLNDPVKLFDSDPAELRSVVAPLPFDVRVLTGSGNTAILEDAKLWVAENTITVAVDAKLHVTYTRFGLGVGVPPHAFDPVALAGNPQFKKGQWEQGIIQIVNSTNQARQSTETAPPTTVIEPTHTMISEWWFIMGGGGALALALITTAAWFFIRARRQEREAIANAARIFNARVLAEESAAEIVSREIKESQYYAKVPVGPAGYGPGPVLVEEKPAPVTAVPVERPKSAPTPNQGYRPSASSYSPMSSSSFNHLVAMSKEPAPKPAPAQKKKAASPSPSHSTAISHTDYHSSSRHDSSSSSSSSSHSHSSSSDYGSSGGGGSYSSSDYGGGGGGSFGDSGGGGGSF